MQMQPPLVGQPNSSPNPILVLLLLVLVLGVTFIIASKFSQRVPSRSFTSPSGRYVLTEKFVRQRGAGQEYSYTLKDSYDNKSTAISPLLEENPVYKFYNPKESTRHLSFKQWKGDIPVFYHCGGFECDEDVVYNPQTQQLYYNPYPTSEYVISQLRLTSSDTILTEQVESFDKHTYTLGAFQSASSVTSGWWATIDQTYAVGGNGIPECSEVMEFPTHIFNSKFASCTQNGQLIKRGNTQN